MDDDDELQWGEPTPLPAEPAAEPPKTDAHIRELEEQLHAARKEIAAKTVQLKKQEAQLAAAKQREAAAEEHANQQGNASAIAAEVEHQVRQGVAAAAAATAEKESQVHRLSAQIDALEASLRSKEEELEVIRKSSAQQKRALAEAQALLAEHSAATQAGDEANRAMVSAVAEEELEALQGELVKARARAELEAHAREVELSGLRAELEAAQSRQDTALSQAEAKLNEAWQAELQRAQAEAQQQCRELQSQLAQLQGQLEVKQNEHESLALSNELALLNNAKTQVQREYDAFRGQATQAARKNREEISNLLAENADLKTRMAQQAAEAMMIKDREPGPASGAKEGYEYGGSDGYDEPPMMGPSYSAYAYQTMEAHLPGLLLRLERQRKGLLPCLIIGGLLTLIIAVSVIRASVSARGAGPLCILSKMGINVGPGCMPLSASEAANKRFAELLDKPQRVHDIEMSRIAAGGGAVSTPAGQPGPVPGVEGVQRGQQAGDSGGGASLGAQPVQQGAASGVESGKAAGGASTLALASPDASLPSAASQPPAAVAAAGGVTQGSESAKQGSKKFASSLQQQQQRRVPQQRRQYSHLQHHRGPGMAKGRLRGSAGGYEQGYEQGSGSVGTDSGQVGGKGSMQQHRRARSLMSRGLWGQRQHARAHT